MALARDAKRRKSDVSASSPEIPTSADLSADQPEPSSVDNTPDLPEPSNSQSNSSSSPSSSVSEDNMYTAYIEDWANSLSRDDQMSLAITLHYALVEVNNLPSNKTADLIASFMGKSERTIREWKYSFIENGGSFPESQQGKYIREGILWQNEELNEAASDYVRANAVVKGKPNLTAISFCHWVNESLLPNSILEPGYPRHVSVQTARTWLHELGFQVLDKKKGVYIDGHERPDVVEHRQHFLRQLVAGGFLTKEAAPSDEARDAFPTDIEQPPPDRCKKNIFIFHDESTFNANDDEGLQWGSSDSQVIRPKSRGSGIMVSDFITENDGYLCLSKNEHEIAKLTDPNIGMAARTLIEYGEARDGYWTNDKFMRQMRGAVKIAQAKYPKEKGYRIFWVFDQSQCHMAYADDALNVNKMNAKEGGAQPCMHDTTYKGKTIYMTKIVRKPTGERVRIPRGLIDVLTQRGCYAPKMKVDEMRELLGNHPDFKNEKNKLEYFLHGQGHACLFIPKFHCETNPIERCWAQAKRYTRAYCNYNIVGLRRNVMPALDSVSQENIKNYFRRAKNYLFAYMLGHSAGLELEKLINRYSKEFKSHRKVQDTD